MTNPNTPTETPRGYDFDAVTSVPSVDIARWIARINLVNYALAENQDYEYGDFVGYMYQNMTEIAKKDSSWSDDPIMEEMMVAELEPSVDFDKVVNGPTHFTDTPGYAEGDDLSMDVQRTALRKGLGRIGLYETAEPHVPLQALAALHYTRGNIKNPIDRKLYERSDEIDESASAIGTLIQSRMTERILLQPVGPESPQGKVRTMETINDQPLSQQERDVLLSIGLLRDDADEEKKPILYEEVVRPMSVYAKASVLSADEARALGLDPDAQTSLWWQELQRDMARIDEASAQLERYV